MCIYFHYFSSLKNVRMPEVGRKLYVVRLRAHDDSELFIYSLHPLDSLYISGFAGLK